MKILLAVDGSGCSEAAARSFAARPWPEGSHVLIVSACEQAPIIAMPEVGGAPTDLYERLNDAARERATAAVEKARRLLGACPTPLTIDTRVIEGYAREVIIDESQRWGADLIVVGSHGYRGLARLWLGSVSQAVASHARCSVEIVRCRSGESDVS